jgi:transposase
MGSWLWSVRRWGHDPFSETIFIFRSKRADRLKILAWDGSGLVLFWKRLEHGAFRWPPVSDGVMRLTAPQVAALVDGMDWSRLHARDCCTAESDIVRAATY